MSRIFNLPRLFRESGAEKRNWYHIDAAGLTVGRVAQTVAKLLTGKHKPIWSPEVDVGDYVVVTNVEKVEFTGHKWRQKIYYRHSTYPGGLKKIPAWRMLERAPDRVLKLAVKGMLPKNHTRKMRFLRLRLCVGPENPYEGQLHPSAHLANPIDGEPQELIAAPSANPIDSPLRAMTDFTIPTMIHTKSGIIIPHNPQILPPAVQQQSMHHEQRLRKLHEWGDLKVSEPESENEPFHMEIVPLAAKRSSKNRKPSTGRVLSDLHDEAIKYHVNLPEPEPFSAEIPSILQQK
eukprot:TRINITY_DN4937_c0_g1_i1.p1 TRINITY_DN4937_c0_g1~~TRINITY_DN4937_c0_g1_i1.p1  ORF type:complete len:305 (+),score=122.32 TRINITY_DN4937_c0_g1_i1:45-917(+)